MTSDGPAEIAILIHHKAPHWKKEKLLIFVGAMIDYEQQLTTLNSRLFTTLNSVDMKAREKLKHDIKVLIFDNDANKDIGPYTFDTNPADAAIKFNVGKRYSNHKDNESLTFKIN